MRSLRAMRALRALRSLAPHGEALTQKAQFVHHAHMSLHDAPIWCHVLQQQHLVVVAYTVLQVGLVAAPAAAPGSAIHPPALVSDPETNCAWLDYGLGGHLIAAAADAAAAAAVVGMQAAIAI